MRNDPGCARPGRRALALLALSVLVTACSLTSMAYNHATRLITWKIDEFFSLDAGQDAEVRMRLDRVLAWHRARQLPDYARFLGQVRDRLRGPVTPADVAWLYGEVKQRIDPLIDAAAPEAAAFVKTLRLEQIRELERRFDRTNERFRGKYLDPAPERVREAFLKGAQERVEYWFGAFDAAQHRRLAEAAEQIPFDPRLVQQDIARRQVELAAILSAAVQGRPAAEVEHDLRRYFGRPEEGRTPEYARYLERQRGRRWRNVRTIRCRRRSARIGRRNRTARHLKKRMK